MIGVDWPTHLEFRGWQLAFALTSPLGQITGFAIVTWTSDERA